MSSHADSVTDYSVSGTTESSRSTAGETVSDVRRIATLRVERVGSGDPASPTQGPKESMTDSVNSGVTYSREWVRAGPPIFVPSNAPI